MWGEISKSVKAVLYDRITSPLLGTFAVSWVLWNHRFITVLFSGMEPIAKFDVIDSALYPTWECLLWRMAVFPLLTTAIFIFLYPYPARFVFELTRKQQKRMKEIRQRIEDETPLTVEESNEIRRAALQAQLLYEKDVQSLTEENQQLRAELQKIFAQSDQKPKRTSSRVDKATKKSVHLGEELSEGAISALIKIGAKRKIYLPILLKELVSGEKISTIKAQHLLDTLLAGHYVELDSMNDELSLKEKGRALLVERGFA